MDAGDAPKRKKKAAGKTCCACDSCGMTAGTRPGVSLICDDCGAPMQAEDEG